MRFSPRCPVAVALAVVLLVAGAVSPTRALAPADLDPILRDLSIRPAWGDAPPVTLAGLDGATHTLDGLRGKVVLLYFWATWCPICTGELPSRIEALHREFGPRGLVVWAVSMRESPADVRAWLARHPISSEVLLDGDGAASQTYRAAGTPTFVLVDRAGQLAGRGVGPREWTGERGRALIRALLGDPA
jgi:peroxiredoxin